MIYREDEDHYLHVFFPVSLSCLSEIVVKKEYWKEAENEGIEGDSGCKGTIDLKDDDLRGRTVIVVKRRPKPLRMPFHSFKYLHEVFTKTFM